MILRIVFNFQRRRQTSTVASKLLTKLLHVKISNFDKHLTCHYIATRFDTPFHILNMTTYRLFTYKCIYVCIYTSTHTRTPVTVHPQHTNCIQGSKPTHNYVCELVIRAYTQLHICTHTYMIPHTSKSTAQQQQQQQR